jgi:hypothetical protein
MANLPPARSINWTDLIAGGAMVAVCGAFVLLARDYGIGRLARIGPGFYPFTFGLIGMALGGLIIAGAFLSPAGSEVPLRWRPLLFVSCGVAAFGLLIEPAGLLPSVLVSTIVTALADREARPVGTAVLALVLTAGVWLVFVKLLGLPIPLFGDFG